MAERIGFIGLGLMGKPMAYHLLTAGYTLTIYNRSRPAVDELVGAGAKAATAPREVAEQSDIVITMLPDGSDVESVIVGSNGLLEGARPEMLFIDMSTISPLTTTHLSSILEQHDVRLLDAPVSGGVEGAKTASLSIMVGGREEDFERAKPLFSKLGKTITYCGSSGSGQIVKACNQVLVALIIEAISESLVLGAKSGVSPDIIVKVLSGGLAQTRFMDLRGESMIRHSFEPGGKAAFHLKDLRIVKQLAQANNVVLPMGTQVEQLFTSLVANGNGNLDHSALLMVIESLSNFSITESSTESH
ncbi:MAG TPA: 2-hydroxy-3-oxopropionate reductase [Ktedonobacter sp.]|nr:2-hydroxy-3-oxopropionate reductase [Ktedonobacter sp.]